MGMKTYTYAVGWACVSEGRHRIIWHNDPDIGGSFECGEDVHSIKAKVLNILKQYSTSAYEWDYAATGYCGADKDGHWIDANRDIEVNVWACCDNKKGNMVRIRAFEDWNSWLSAMMMLQH